MTNFRCSLDSFAFGLFCSFGGHFFSGNLRAESRSKDSLCTIGETNQAMRGVSISFLTRDLRCSVPRTSRV